MLTPPAALPQAGSDLLLPVPQCRQPAGFAGRHSAFRRSPRQANLTVPRLCLKRWSGAKSNRAWCKRKSPGTLEMGTSPCTHCPDSAFVAGREVGRHPLQRQQPPRRGSPRLPSSNAVTRMAHSMLGPRDVLQRSASPHPYSRFCPCCATCHPIA